MSSLALISVYDTATPERHMYEKFLFDLLKDRKPWESISHKKMPHYDEHVKFVRSKPYKKWYIIDYRGPVGSIYLTHENQVGIFIERHNQGRKFGAKALNMLLEDSPNVETIYANIGAFNSRSLCFFVMKGFKQERVDFKDNEDNTSGGTLLQYVYRIRNPYVIMPQAHARSS